ncbi:MAG: molybdopterin-dependent oxidoreductase, partial [Burkholderiaceae bacterium]
RCIHCTRCVRFGQEIAGVMELGMAGRGEHSQIMSFVGRSVDSELSGNMIDVCPVGALTSKPFRYSARTWELSRRRSIAPHDSLGSNLIVQVKNNQVMRVVPLEDEAVNECWLSDKDRFSYEGLNADERLLRPMVKQDGQWREVDWQTALQYAAHALGSIAKASGGARIGALVSPHATVEEAYLSARLLRELGSDNVDSRLRQVDFSAGTAVPSLGRSVASLSSLGGALIVGSFLRKDHPLMASRLRQAVKGGARVGMLHAAHDDLLMPLAARASAAPSQWAAVLSRVLVALLRAKDSPVPADLAGVEPDEQAEQLAACLQGEDSAVLLGNAVVQHAGYARLASLAQRIAHASGASFGHFVEAANTVGAQLVGAVPLKGGLDARAMVEQPLGGYLLVNVDPDRDHALPRATVAALRQAESVVALSVFRSAELLELADCLLPIAPFTETAGSFVNAEGRLQSFNGVVRPAGEARPAWKVLRVLGNLLELPGFEFETAEAVRDQALRASSIEARLAAGVAAIADAAPRPDADAAQAAADAATLERIADVPIYAADPLVRRAESLQLTRDAAVPRARMNAATLLRLGIATGDKVRVTQQGGEALVEALLDEQVADGVVRLAAAVPATAGLASMVGRVAVARA